MDEFGYLSVLLSIIIGLAMTEILQGLRKRMLYQDRVQRYWVSQLWAATLLLVCAQTWWAMFDLRNRHDWQFDQFVALLTQSILLYLGAGLLFPEFSGEGPVDMRAHYFRQRKRFFGLLIAVTLASVYRDWVLDHRLPSRPNLAFHVVYLITSAIAIATAREWYHKLLAVLIAAVFLFYVTTLFARLH